MTPSKLPPPPHEVPVDADLSKLAPRFRTAVERVLAEMKDHGHTPMVFEAFRSPERQAFLHGFGREYDDGRGKVTASPAGHSWHEYGLGVDVICAKRGWDAPPAFWRALGSAARGAGLTWGGDWSHPDLPHIQWGKCRPSPSDEGRRLLKQGGLAAVWRAVKAL